MEEFTMSRSTLVAVIVLASLAPAARAAGQPASPLPADDRIRDILIQRVDVERRNAGIVVGIVTPEGRRVIVRGTSGRSDGAELSGETVFEIGSVTKVFTSLLLADMARRGEIDIEDSVSSHLPVKVGAGSDRAITLADLATHTSGLPFWPSGIPATREGALSMATYSVDRLYEYLAGFDIPADVGTKWAYSNIDAGVLGLALAHRAGTTYEALLESRITGPLRMKSTAVTISQEMTSRMAVGHDAGFKPAPRWNVPALAGAGSLVSGASDMLAFLASFGQSSVSSAALPTMLATRRQGPGIPQALGWWIVSTSPSDKGILVHDGGTLGFASSVAYDPETRTGVVVLSNSAAAVGDIARHILRPAIPLTAPAGAAPEKKEIQVDPALFDRYSGRYEPAPGVAFTLTREADALMIQLPGTPKLRLRAESERDFFVAENTRVGVSFVVDPDGRVTGLLLRSPAGEASATRVEERR
jgi:D-alanyl-D-alanine-carboxypeptidase/D-alanyl-D-alanine-endopeptidase